MMRPFIAYYFWEMQTKVWWGFLIFLCFYCFKVRQGFEGEWSLYVLTIITDPFLLIYVMTLIFMHSAAQLYREPLMVEMIRIRFFYRMILAKWLAAIRFSLLFVGTKVLIVSLFSVGLDNGFTWKGTMDESFRAFLIESYQSPLHALVYTIAFMVLGYSFIGCTFVTIDHYFSKKIAYGLILLNYIVMILAFKMPWMEVLTYISLNRFVILHHNFASNYTWQGTLLIVLVGFVMQFIILKKWWYTGELLSKGQPIVRQGIFHYYGRILFAKQSLIIWLVGLTVMITMKASTREETLQDFITRFFYGYSNGEVHIFTWIEQLVYVGVPLYLFAAFMQQWLVKRDWPLYIRIYSKKQWIQAFMLLIGLYAVSYVLLTLVLIGVAGILFDKLLFIDASELLYIVGMKTLEIGLLLGILFFLFIVTDRVLLAFSGIPLLFVVNYLSPAWTSFNVAGIGQLARVEEMNQSMVEMGFAGIFYIVILISLIGCSYKKYFKGG